MEYNAPSPQATKEISAVFADYLDAGDIIGLTGALGAGKTTFIAGLLAALDYQGPVTSPTFTLMHQYDARLPVFHLDAFRLKNKADFLSLGWDDFLRDDVIVVVEWADRISDYFDLWTWRVSLRFVPEDDSARRIGFWCRDTERLKRFEKSLRRATEEI